MIEQAQFRVEDDNDETVARFDVGATPFKIGREDGNDLILRTQRISRQHMELVVDNGICFVKDLNSSNGVILNGRRIAPDNLIDLTVGDIIDISPYKLVFLGFIGDATDDAPEPVQEEPVAEPEASADDEPTPEPEVSVDDEPTPEPEASVDDEPAEEEDDVPESSADDVDLTPEATDSNDDDAIAATEEASDEETSARAVEDIKAVQPDDGVDETVVEDTIPEAKDEQADGQETKDEPKDAKAEPEETKDEPKAAKAKSKVTKAKSNKTKDDSKEVETKPKTSKDTSETDMPTSVEHTMFDPTGYRPDRFGKVPPNKPPNGAMTDEEDDKYPFGIPRLESTWLRYLPAVFHEYVFLSDEEKKAIGLNGQDHQLSTPFISRFLLIFESILSPIVWHLDNFDMYLDERITDEKWLQWIASWFDLLLLPELPEDTKRKIITQIGSLFKQRGTKEGLERLLTLYFNLPIEVIEPEDQLCHFEVTIYLLGKPIDLRPQIKRDADIDENDQRDEIIATMRDVATRLIDSQCPAFTTYHLELSEY